MKICIGKSRREKVWQNKEISWQEFTNIVKNTVRTSETMVNYKRFSKPEQDEVKDVGGFVGGHLKGGRRKKGNIICRSLLTLDMDYGRENIWEEICQNFEFKCCIYSTHKHAKEKPRLRLIIPLSSEIEEDKYEPIARMVAKEIGIDLFDDSTYESSRLMYWPSTSIDGEFVFAEKEGPLLNGEDYLNKYKNYKDFTTWPVSSRKGTIIKTKLNSQEDPLTKENIVGVFCRTYTVSQAIDKFLSDVYAPSLVSGRYDYIEAESTAGVVIYDDKFAYSHHSSDKASAQLLNAFDLVRIHKFGDLDEDAKDKTPSNKLPSFIKMSELVIDDELVKIQLVRKGIEDVESDFTNEEEKEDKDEKLNIKSLYKNEKAWEVNLKLNKKGEVKDSLDNIDLILRNDINLQNIVYNSHISCIYAKGELPWNEGRKIFGDGDYASLKVYLSKKYKIYSPSKTRDAILSIENYRKYHPIKEYLKSLPPWDNIPRVESLLIDYLGAEDSSYTRAVMRKTLCAAIARVYNPGEKFDQVLILNGPQGIGKSMLFEKLSNKWFSDSLTITDMKDKSACEKLQGYWILELSELAGMKKAEVEIVKSFISRTDDKYRASYGVFVESHPRQCIIVGTTNAQGGFLRDITGNRRYWPVKVNGDSKKKVWDMTKEEIDQIWAETLVYYKKGEILCLKGRVEAMANKEQSDSMESDDREGLVRDYLDTLLPTNWDKMDLYERRNFLRGGGFCDEGEVGTIERRIVCNMEIWSECFGNNPSNIKAADSYEISAIMKKIGTWNKYLGNKKGSVNLPIYGTQRCYEKAKN